MRLSKFGTKFTSKSGILELMDDLGKALASPVKKYPLGGGNPGHIPEMENIYRKRMEDILKDGDRFEKMVGNYTAPQGDLEFISSFATLLKNKYGWDISEKNVCVLGGSQTTFFFLFNLLAGQYPDGSFKKILLPIVPEYIGYEDQGIEKDFFTSVKPKFNFIDEHTFKYQIDFDNLKVTPDISAICVSRPTNPTGNVITNEEVEKLIKLSEENDIPLIMDSAYGQPFPNAIFTDAKPYFGKNIINVYSFSKIGLPSSRTSVIVGPEELIEALAAVNAIVSLAPGTIGQYLVLDLIKTGEIFNVSDNVIKPFYEKRSVEAVEFFHSKMDPKLPYYIHKSEGAFFLWFYFKDLPITTYELYQKLKKKNVIVVPGKYFFAGVNENWKHKDECIRVTYSQGWEDVKKGLEIIAKVVTESYKK